MRPVKTAGLVFYWIENSCFLLCVDKKIWYDKRKDIERKVRSSMDKWINNIVGKMVADGTIEAEDTEIYAFGLKQGIIMIINYVLTILIGLIMRMPIETLIFMAVYIPIRSYAGGVHAKTQRRCFVYSNLIVVAILLAIRYFVHSSIILCGILLFAAIVVTLLAPVEDKNKPLDEDEVRIYGRKARLMLCGYLLLALVCIFLKWWMPAVSIVLTLGLMAVVLILGKIKNYRLDREAETL